MRSSTRVSFCILLALAATSSSALATDVCGNVFGAFVAAASPYHVTCDLVVPDTTTLIIDAGVELRFTSGTGLQVDGDLQVNGTSVSPVLLTSDLASPTPGDWAQVTVNGSASLDWTSVRYGGGFLVTGSLDAADCQFQFNGGATTPPAISFGSGTTGSVSNSLFDQNSRPLSLGIDANPELSGLTVNLNHAVLNGVEVTGGTWSVSRDWTDADVPYAFNSPPTFGAGTVQTLEAGVVFKLFAPDNLVFDQVVVLGSVAQPVVFTSIWDDAAGGDTFPGAGTSPGPGDWGELSILGVASLDHLQVRYGSGTTLQDSATVSGCRFTANNGGATVLVDADFSGCVFEFNQVDPAVTFGPATSGSVTDSVFDANYHPILLDRNSDPSFSNLSIHLNHTFLNGVQVRGGNWTISRTWNDPSAPYALDSSTMFSTGTTQTLEPGVVFKLFPNTPPSDGVFFDGLIALGSSTRPIIFTSLADTTAGGDTLPGLPSPAEGDWGPLEVAATADLDLMQVRYASSIDLRDTATIVDSAFDSNSVGLVVHGTASIDRASFTSNGLADGNPALTFESGAGGSVSDSKFSANHVPVFLRVDSNPTLTNLDVLEDHALLNGVRVEGGPWAVDRTWSKAGAPYMPDLDIDFSPASTQTVDPGAVFKFAPSGGAPLSLTFGNLIAVGTASEPIVFTSALDRSIFPFAMVGVPDPPTAGDWAGLVFTAGGAHQVDHARVSYAESGLVVDTVSGTIERSRFTDNVRALDIVSGGFARVTETDFLNNGTAVGLDTSSTGDLGNLGDVDPLNDGLNSFVCNVLHVENLSASTLPAENNWWNKVPPDPASIVGPVDDVPFLTAPPRPVLQSLVVGLINSQVDVQLEWEDLTPSCGYRVIRSTQPDSGFVDVSGLLGTSSYVDPGAGPSPASYFYRVLID